MRRARHRARTACRFALAARTRDNDKTKADTENNTEDSVEKNTSDKTRGTIPQRLTRRTRRETLPANQSNAEASAGVPELLR